MAPALVLLGVLGAVVGSFLNVVAHRVPDGRSVVRPRSACPACGHPIRWYDNLPILSWLVLGGRCRDCRAPIPARYPLVEASTAAAYVLVGWWWLSGLRTAPLADAIADLLLLTALLTFLAASIVLAVIDARVHRLPDAIVLPTAVAVAVLLTAAAWLAGDWADLGTAGIGATALAAFYLLLAIIVPGGMGLGDVKLALPIGLLLGWFGIPSLVVGALGAFLLGGAYGLILVLLRRRGRRGRVAFGPWMLLAAWVGIIAGNAIAGAYLRLFGLQMGGTA